MYLYPLLALLVVLPGYIAAEYRARSVWLKLALKSACSVLFVAAAFLAALGAPEGWRGWHAVFLVSFLVSAAGDVLLGLPDGRAFPAGLGAFFVAQCCFVEALVSRWGLSPWDSLLFAALAGLALALLFRSPRMDYGTLRFPVAIYAVALSAMAAKAVSGVYLFGGIAGWSAMAGGLLFYTSDVILAFMQFGSRRVPCLRALNLTAYYLGQALLALSLYA